MFSFVRLTKHSGYLEIKTTHDQNNQIDQNHGCTALMHVNNHFQCAGDQNLHQQFSAIRKMLNADPASCTFCCRNGQSKAWLQDKIFYIVGGEFGPSFGSQITFAIDFDAWQDQIRAFLHFLLEAEQDETDSDSN
jgi:hypothetical protein